MPSDCKIIVMRFWLAAWLVLVLGVMHPAWSGASPESGELGIDEVDLSAKAREGRLTQDEIIQMGEDLPYFTRLKLYLYAKELEPFFEGVEDSFRNLARSDPGDKTSLDKGRRQVFEAMSRARARLFRAERENPEIDWRRGLIGLIWLDHDWRGRVYEQGKDEITNPYDLVALVDCLDAQLRGLETGGYANCPVVRKNGGVTKGVRAYE